MKIDCGVVGAMRTRDEMARWYADLIRETYKREVYETAEVNRRIIDRWSLSALEYIKRKAWKIFEREWRERE